MCLCYFTNGILTKHLLYIIYIYHKKNSIKTLQRITVGFFGGVTIDNTLSHRNIGSGLGRWCKLIGGLFGAFARRSQIIRVFGKRLVCGRMCYNSTVITEVPFESSKTEGVVFVGEIVPAVVRELTEHLSQKENKDGRSLPSWDLPKVPL